MLTFFGGKQRFCDGLSRRNFLKVGALGTGGLTLADLLRLEAQAGSSSRPLKSIINIYLPGGPTHMDTFDLKPGAPAEFRGEFRPIATNVPGMEICELMPKLAQLADKYAIIRSVTGVRDEHSARQSDSGWSENDLRSIGGHPGIGPVMSRVYGTVNGTAPTSVALSGFTDHGFLPQVYRDFRPDGEGRNNLRLNNNMSAERLSDRKSLLDGLDRIRREMDQKGAMTALDSFNERALTVITSGTLAEALDSRKEDPRVLDRYGLDRQGSYGGNRNFLLARRLVEAGVRVVSVSWGGWDTHGQNFQSMRQQLPALDVGLSALFEDLDARGLLADTMIMMSGEFGRTPRINGGAGRDHWAPASFFFLGGGGLKTGQVVGSTNRLGERPQDRPVHLQHIFATVYKNLGIDVESTTLADPNGRPQYLVEQRETIKELI
jgi:hypothetical protein